MSEAAKMKLELNVDNPEPGGKGWFGLLLESADSLTAEDSFEVIVKSIEFRRRCANQGFDNLLELINLTRESLLKQKKSAEQEEKKT